jgi:hypothetical protein
VYLLVCDQGIFCPPLQVVEVLDVIAIVNVAVAGSENQEQQG